MLMSRVWSSGRILNSEHFPPSFLLHDSPETIRCSAEHNVLFAQNCDPIPAQASRCFLSRINMSLINADEYVTLPLDITTQSVGSLEYTWDNKV